MEQRFIIDSNVVIDFLSGKLTEKVVQKSIELRKEYKIKIPDAIIAASAITSGLKLLTRNIRDFEVIKGIVVINPHF